MMSLHKLESFAVVYPRKAGTWDLDTDTPPLFADEDGNMLREMYDEEGEACIIQADYVREQHGWNERIVWSRKARDHIGFAAASLVDYMAQAVAMESNPKRVPLYWDARNRMLKLEFRALVWDDPWEEDEEASAAQE
ncbi:hypothetical protein B0T14DRAFT_519701 [Immersiella caudata]|uniref:Uncharacterized protein n=1 Tax=Immersiella caudata TaxID=314043 RepID=A0AA40BZF2_9PEZI|nr:hypothetical protein B0T14DRAFT_519701 [Immersiella caudata]